MIITVSKPEKRYPQVEGNLIENNKGHGLLYSGTEGIVVARNQISHNSKHAISLVHPSEITIQDNCLKNNNLSGVNVELGVCCSIQGNGIFDNGENGIVTAGSGNIKENDIFGHEYSSIYIRSNSDTYVDHNRLHSFNQECIFIEAKSRCVLDSNQIFKDFSNTDAVRIDVNSETTYNNNNTVETVKDAYNVFEDSHHLEQIQPNPSKNYFISKLDVLKPVHNEILNSAPFYTAMDTVRANPRSMFCVVL